MSVTIETIQKEDKQILVVRGHVDAAAAEQLAGALQQAIAASARCVIVDLGQNGFLDSSGLGTLVHALRAARDAHVELILADLARPVMVLLQMTGLDRVFTTYPSVAEAVRATRIL